MDVKALDFELIKATDKFAETFKETLNNADLDEKTFNVLYDLGADIRHALDDFHVAIVRCLKED